MQNRINAIMREEDPQSREVSSALRNAGQNLGKFLVIGLIICCVIAIIISSQVGAYLENAKDLSVDIFGLNFEIDDDSFWAGSFMIFVYVFLCLIAIFMTFFGIIAIMLCRYEAKITIMNNTYRTNKLLELYILTSAGTNVADAAGQQPSPNLPQREMDTQTKSPEGGRVPTIEEYMQRRAEAARQQAANSGRNNQ